MCFLPSLDRDEQDRGKGEGLAGMRVEPIRGEFLRYRVHSETKGDEEHVVDLHANDGNGECSCDQFTFRCGPMWSKTKEMVNYERGKDGKLSPATRCKHLNAAFLHLATSVAQEAQVEERAKPTTVRASNDGLPF